METPQLIVNIHGRQYDVTCFEHPGGTEPLKIASCEADATPMFQSYHAMSVLEHIKEKNVQTYLSSYSMQDSPTPPIHYTFNENSFYAQLKKKVRDHFSEKNISHKATSCHLVKMLVFFVLFFIVASMIIVRGKSHLHLFCLGSLLGALLMVIAFGMMHDASHFAFFKNNGWNTFLRDFWSVVMLWNGYIWGKHHVYAHHSFTGEALDPDEKWFITKTNPHPLFKFPAMLFLPGLYLFQIFSYVRSIYSGSVFGTKVQLLQNLNCIDCLYILPIGFHCFCIFDGKLMATFGFFLSSGFIYAANILPDHFTAEANSPDHGKVRDWGELQVRRASNFGASCPALFSFFLGGMNYQIEHHLFPGISSCHYPDISGIVRTHCEQNGVPYVTFTYFGAFYSIYKRYKQHYV